MSKQVSVLAFIAALALGLGVWLNQTQTNTTYESSLLLADFHKHASQVDSVQIDNAQGTLFSAQMLDGQWLVTFDTEQPVYPVAFEDLSAFVTTMMEAQLIEAKTSKPKNFNRLGLQGIDKEDSLARLVSLEANGHTWRVLVGNSASVGEGSYVRLPEDNQSWRTDLSISLPTDQYAWLKQPVLPYSAENIQSISSVDIEGADWQMLRQAPTDDFQLSTLPADRSLQYEGVLQSFVSSLTSLDFERLQMDDETLLPSLETLATLEIVTLDDVVFQATISKLHDQHYIRFTSETLSEYWLNWRYQISHFSAQQLIKSNEDFLASIEVEDTVGNDVSQEVQVIEEGESPN